MRSSKARRHSDTGLFGGAGWLFADLMLAVVVVAYLASVINTKPPDPPSPPPTESAATSTTVLPTTTTPPRREGLNPNPIPLNVDTDARALLAGDPAVVDALKAYAQASLAGPLAGRRAGIVLTFGSAPSSDIQRGIRLATQFDELVLKYLGDQFRDSTYRPFFQNDKDPHKVITVEIYVFDT